MFSKTKEEHQTQLKTVVEVLTKAKFLINQQKSSLFRTELKALGYIIDQNGYRIDSVNIEKGVEFTTPKSESQPNSFLGTANFARFHVPNYATIAAPLDDL